MNKKDTQIGALHEELVRLSRTLIGMSFFSFALFFISLAFFLESDSVYRTGTASGWYVSLLKEVSINFV